MSDSNTPYGNPAAPVPVAAPPARGSGLSIAALAVGIAAFVSAVIPGLSFVAFIPALVAIGLGIAALVSRAGARGAAITGLVLGPVSLIVAIIVSVAFAASVVTPQTGSAPVENTPAVVAPGEVPAEEPAAPAAEVGTRENPAPAGTVVEITNASGPVWRVELGAANLNAGDVIAAENQFNEPADAGSQYVLVPVTFTYVGPDSGTPWVDVSIEFVSAAGTTHIGSTVVAPTPVFDINELYTDASGTGNIVVMAPSENIESGTWAISALFGEPYFVKVV